VVDSAGQQMQALMGGVEQISVLIAEMSSAADRQSSGLRQVGSAANAMDRVAQQNAALVERTVAAPEERRNRARELVQAVSRFRVDAQPLP
jgi:methyl-accepting chemotaxis protein